MSRDKQLTHWLCFEAVTAKGGAEEAGDWAFPTPGPEWGMQCHCLKGT